MRYDHPAETVTDPVDGSVHDLSHERPYAVGDRVENTYDLVEGVVTGLGHVQPATFNTGYDGKQNFPASRWYEVKQDDGKTKILNPQRLRPLS